MKLLNMTVEGLASKTYKWAPVLMPDNLPHAIEFYRKKGFEVVMNKKGFPVDYKGQFILVKRIKNDER